MIPKPARTCGSGFTREASGAVDGTGCAGVRGHGRSYRYSVSPKPAPYLWERVHPRSRLRGGWHRLCRCSRPRPLPQVQREPEACAVPVGAGMPAKQAVRWMAPATPVFAATAAPTGTARARSLRRTCGSGHAREAGDAVDGTGCAGVRGHGRSHRYSVIPKPAPYLWERACPRSRRRGGCVRLLRRFRVQAVPVAAALIYHGGCF